MERIPRSETPSTQGRSSNLEEVRVHVLSEHVFCPRAAVLAMESGDDNGEEERLLGPRLDGFEDYDEQRFAEELHISWKQFCFWFTLLAPTALLILVVWRFSTPVWGALVSLPCLYVIHRLWQVGVRIVALGRDRAAFVAADSSEVDLTSDQIRDVNWWSLRKAGFDCHKPQDAYVDLAERLIGRPWRVLTKGTTLRIPVIRKHRGERIWRPQHVVRIAAYCRLIETCELGDAPFGVLMFADNKECLIIPNSNVAKFQFEKALEDAREFLAVSKRSKLIPPMPTDNRCCGCYWGMPREYVKGETETVLNGNPVKPLLTKANKRYYHCPCGDQFGGVPQHDDAIALGIAEPR